MNARSVTVSIRVFGLTGGVASGKSSVARIFREQGLPVLDADQIARHVVEPGSQGLARVVEAFGQPILQPDGRLDRAKLGARIFADPDERRLLNRILHPLIGAETARRTQQLAEQGVALACYEAALLVENGLADAFRPLVVVALPAELQLKRLIERDGIAASAAQQRIAAQLPLADKVALADYVIDNSGDLPALERAARHTFSQIRAACAERGPGEAG